MLEILKHDGPARLGRLRLEVQDVDLDILTPNFLSLKDNSWTLEHEIYLASHVSAVEWENVLVDYGSLYEEKRISRFGILPDERVGLKVPRDIAEYSVDKTLEFAMDYPEYGAVIQGSRYLDLRLKCAKALSDRPLLVIADSVELLDSPRLLVEIVTAVRDVISPNTALYYPFAPPYMFYLLAYMGVDLFDTGNAFLNAKKRIICTSRDNPQLDSLGELPCTCSVCRDKRPEDLMGDYNAIIAHNFNVTLGVVREIRVAIKNNGFRELVEEKAAVAPKTMAILRLLDREKQEYLERYTQIVP
jgi:queuine/archaeosine tRNA-ribosyltransferase